MNIINWDDFSKVELRVGKIIEVQDFPKANNPAYIVYVDFGEQLGIRKSSAQITQNYKKEALIGKKVLAVVNFPKKQIGPIQSECLITGLHDELGGVYLCVPDGDVPLGTKLL